MLPASPSLLQCSHPSSTLPNMSPGLQADSTFPSMLPGMRHGSMLPRMSPGQHSGYQKMISHYHSTLPLIEDFK